MENKKSGFIIINKQINFTSHDVIVVLRGITGIKKIGHAGTLDPFATGILICAIGREATKKISQFVKLDKEYEATLKLGVESDTYDREGKMSKVKCQRSKRDEIIKVLDKFIGKQEQVAPMFSAKKIGGKKLYELARAGKIIKRKPCKIEIYDIKLLKYKWPDLEIKVRCSTGTYIRSLGHDIGQALECGAYLEEITRIGVGKFKLPNAVELGKLNKRNWDSYIVS